MLRRNNIWSHTGRELKLMLAGRKKLAIFCDTSSENGQAETDEIPEEAFAPYVARGRIVRLEASVSDVRNGSRIRFVCFALPGSEWRAQAFLWIKREAYSGQKIPDIYDDVMTARLLGYSHEEIARIMETSGREEVA